MEEQKEFPVDNNVQSTPEPTQNWEVWESGDQQLPQEIAQAQAIEQENPIADQPEIPVTGPKTPSQSFQELKKSKLRAEQERDEAIARLRALEQSQESEDFTVDIGENEFAEGKHLSRVQKEINALKKQLRTYQQRTVEMTAEARLKSQFPDFDKVVTQENIQLLNESEPELAATLATAPDLYTKSVSAYKMIKKLNITNADEFENERQRALKNSTKPRPSVSISPHHSDSPLTRANAFAQGLTPEVQKQLLKEMNESRMR
jgi:hypothetical protein